MTFEEKLARLDEIASTLDAEETELGVALQLFEEGVQLLRSAASELSSAEGKVKTLVEKLDGSFDLTDFPS